MYVENLKSWSNLRQVEKIVVIQLHLYICTFYKIWEWLRTSCERNFLEIWTCLLMAMVGRGVQHQGGRSKVNSCSLCRMVRNAGIPKVIIIIYNIHPHADHHLGCHHHHYPHHNYHHCSHDKLFFGQIWSSWGGWTGHLWPRAQVCIPLWRRNIAQVSVENMEKDDNRIVMLSSDAIQAINRQEA